MNDTISTWAVTFPAYREQLFWDKINRANRRLEKAGTDARFGVATREFTVKTMVGGIELDDGTRMFGTEVEVPWVEATISDLSLSLGDFTFCASLVREEAGYTVHCAPGEDLSSWKRPDVDDVHCDHCGTKRNRNRLYVIRNNDTGELLQIGHSCIELYLGLAPKGLWALQFDEELKAFASEDSGGGFSSRDYGTEVRKVLAYAFVFSDSGKSYRSTNSTWEGGPVPTGQAVRSALFVTPRPPRQSDYRRGGYAKALAAYEKYLDDLREADRVWREESELLDDILSVAETIDATSDYGQNMQVILAGEMVSYRNIGTLASLVAVYARERELRAERESAPEPAKGFLAEVKTRIKDPITLKLKTVRHWEGDYGMTTLLVGYTPEMHCVVWKASGFHDLDPGDTITLAAATVKAHEQYHGIDQTVLTRCKFAESV